jgi:hypothetical protein
MEGQARRRRRTAACDGGNTSDNLVSNKSATDRMLMQSLIGIWKLVATRAFDEAGREMPSPFGPQPMGVAIFNTERGMAMGCDSRATLPLEAKRVFVAYCGRYTFDGTKLVTRVDGASSPDLLADQVRHIRFEGPGRMTAVPVSRLFGRSGGVELDWERVG